MPNSEGAVIPMPVNFSDITFLVGSPEELENMQDIPSLCPFADITLDFFECVSKRLLSDPETKQYPDVAAYAFWIRRKSLEKARDSYNMVKQRLGRGITFHITPSNIPVQFAVSMTYALVAGNASIIRVSNKAFPQVDLIVNAINDAIKEMCIGIAPYICILRYEHNQSINEHFSDICDVRMIWGGNATIESIRKAEVQPRCLDLAFADRYSFAVINAEDYINNKWDKEVIANDFYIDTYYSDQNACSSSRLVIWCGDNIETAKDLFWSTLSKIVAQKYDLNEITGSDKLLLTSVLAAKHPGVKMIKDDNSLVRIELPMLFEDIMDYKGNSGYFFEYSADNLEEIVLIMKKECQTVTFLGNLDTEIREIISKFGVKGVDRIVPIGHSMDLSFVWDSYDLPVVLSREISSV